MLKIIDISKWQSVATAGMDGIDGVIVKATQGTGYVSPHCDGQYQLAKSKGRLLGTYHYAGGGNAKAEAEFYYNNIKGYLGESVPALDWEMGENAAWGNINWPIEFINHFETLSGVTPLVYVQASAIGQVATLASKCGLWVAGYPSNGLKWDNSGSMPYSITPWKDYTLWQFSGDDLDRNWANITREGWLAIAKGSRNTPAPTPKPAVQPTYNCYDRPLEQIATDLIDGKLGDGELRVVNLGQFAPGVNAIIQHRKDGDATKAITILYNETMKDVYGRDDIRKNYLGSYYNDVQKLVNQNKSTASSSRVYVVQNGDTLTGIGAKVGVGWVTIATMNGIHAPYIIQPGQKLKY